jgi:hypothetical protein
MSERIGPKMRQAQLYVKHHPGCTKHEVAKDVGPRGSIKWGYDIVNRAIAAGLIKDHAKPEDPKSALYVVIEA